MSDEKQTELTPQEQEQQDEQRVNGQLLVTDVKRTFETVFGAFGFGGGSSGRTSFEGHELNAMIDLIENSNPADLENAGKALLDARDALNDAAKELSDSIKAVDWEGESGTAFRDWGNSLVTHTENLGKFAQAAGTQITVAGTGLASVRNSLPPRDTRLNRRKPEEVEAPKRVEGNPEYQAALKVEKDRQEAINQANRLASYYAVSEEALAGQEPPRFDKKLDVAVPRPQGHGRRAAEPGGDSSWGGSGDVSSPSGALKQATNGISAITTPVGVEDPASIGTIGPVPSLDKGVSTEINTVGTPPAPVVPASAPPPQQVTNPVAPPGPSGPPMPNTFVNPVTTTSRWSQGPIASAPKTVQPTTSGPRTGGPTNTTNPPANGRTGNPVGRPPLMTGGPASGASGQGGGSQPPVGRPPMVGGGQTAGSPVGRPGASGFSTGRATGIVGGTPQRSASGGPGGTRGVPRGTVIGAGSAPQAGRPAGGAGRGVIGSTGVSGAPRPTGRGTPSTNGVVGTPRGGAAGARGFTAGGAGLVRGPAGRRDSDREDQEEGSQRPDYLVEDRETWDAGRRGTAPPVVE
ncbi:hypothetical protein CP967_08010 [Streptomyces nitrosporeus]|uniref:PPE domain-containing protein n=1 Tax=Streptomyces nitrosporeus TaxID=28894 RepID=A0A5J6FA52_9ACTN|nr:hypothetical protein [Streptomyces nitrosporeus]QEU71915.1 hypothetical protein CP967_08010 [Streptomyces nitrosporeus]GGY81894.1 hypothetical protein GCM10010327_10850 [Streptomyces nitrosporeus]